MVSGIGNLLSVAFVISIVKMIVFFFSKLYLSSIAALDFMVGTVVESYNYESHFRDTIEAQRRGELKGEGQKELMAMQMHERMAGLAALNVRRVLSVYDELRQPRVVL